MIVLAIQLGFIGIILAITGITVLLRKRSYDKCSQPVTATVIDKHTRKGKSAMIYELHVSYDVNGVAYKKYMRTSGEDYDLQSEGSQIDLLYKPDNPQRAVRPLNKKDAKSGSILLIIGAVMIAACVVLLIIGRMQ